MTLRHSTRHSSKLLIAKMDAKANAKNQKESLKSKLIPTKRKPDCSDNASNDQNFKTRSMQNKEDIQLSWPDIRNSCIPFIQSQQDSRPPNPYRIGYRFKAQAHIPETELPLTWESCPSEKKPYSPGIYCGYSRNLLQGCQKYPPLPGAMGKDSIELEIQGWVRVGQECGAQLFTVSLSESSLQQDTCISNDIPRSGLVAKVYDPLYTSAGYWCDNWVHCVNEWYIREAKFYQVLLDLQGIGIPKYYGSYSVSLPMPTPQSNEASTNREVRMILIELIKGITMSDFERPRDLPQQVRKNIIRAIIELESEIYERGVDVGHVNKRNIILKEPLHADSKARVILVDFERAFNRCTQEEADDPVIDGMRVPDPKRFTGKYVSPLLRWKFLPQRFSDWIDWQWEAWVNKEFWHTAGTITPGMREVWGPPAKA